MESSAKILPAFSRGTGQFLTLEQRSATLCVPGSMPACQRRASAAGNAELGNEIDELRRELLARHHLSIFPNGPSIVQASPARTGRSETSEDSPLGKTGGQFNDPRRDSVLAMTWLSSASAQVPQKSPRRAIGTGKWRLGTSARSRPRGYLFHAAGGDRLCRTLSLGSFRGPSA